MLIPGESFIRYSNYKHPVVTILNSTYNRDNPKSFTG
jgi:hypothetical protein